MKIILSGILSINFCFAQSPAQPNKDLSVIELSKMSKKLATYKFRETDKMWILVHDYKGNAPQTIPLSNPSFYTKERAKKLKALIRCLFVYESASSYYRVIKEVRGGKLSFDKEFCEPIGIKEFDAYFTEKKGFYVTMNNVDSPKK